MHNGNLEELENLPDLPSSSDSESQDIPEQCYPPYSEGNLKGGRPYPLDKPENINDTLSVPLNVNTNDSENNQKQTQNVTEDQANNGKA